MKKSKWLNAGCFIFNYPGKILLKMKLTLMFILAGIIQVVALDSYSQTTRLTVELRNASVVEVLRAIENQSEFYFVYNKEAINMDRKVDLDAKNLLIEEILNQLFKYTNVSYQITDRHIILSTLEANQQQKTVTGKVTDQSGASLPGVSVVVKGTTSGVITDTNGNFSLLLPPDAKSIAFSFVGMKTQEVNIEGKNSVNVKMYEGNIILEEVVSIGYGTMKRSDLTGSLSSISSKDIQNHPMNDFSQVLQGRASGVSVSTTTGSPGQAAKIRVRGANSLSGGNDPIFIVDGIAMSYDLVNVNDIKSVEVLKDASATAIYGSRGANGVILITTQRGNSQKPRITLSSNIGISQVCKKYDLLDAPEYATLTNNIYGKDVYTAAQIESFRQNGGTNWQNEVFHNGLTQNYQASVSGGGNQMKYYISGNYIDEAGTLINTDRKKYNFKAALENQFSERLSLGFNLSAMKNDRHNPTMGNGGAKTNPIWSSIIWSPTESVYNADGSYNTVDDYGALSKNPVMIAKESLQDNYNQVVNVNTNIKYKILDGLNFEGIASVTRTGNENRNYNSPLLTSTSAAERSYADNTTWQLTALLSYNKVIKDFHSFSFVLGSEESSSKDNSFGGAGTNLSINSFGYYNMALGLSPSVNSGYGEWSLQSYFGRLNYNYKSRYFFTGTYRADGSSKFGKNNRYAYFPSFALSWNAADEPFIKNLNIFDKLKIRSSWGITGNQALSPYATLSLMQTQNYSWASNTKYTGYAPNGAGNPDLRWEETKQLDYGLDMAFLKNKISMSFDFFKKQTTGLLIRNALPLYDGGFNTWQNIGQIDNRGFEFDLNYTPIQKNDFSWTINFNLSTVKNNVVSLGDKSQIFGDNYAAGVLDTNPCVVMVGQPLGSFWGYKFLGIWGSNEATEAAKFGNKPGDSKYQDVNNDHVINSTDYQIIGNSNPDFSWGMNNAISYKNFELNILLQGVQGRDVFDVTYATAAAAISESRTITLKEAANSWTTTNQNTIWPAISSTNKNFVSSSKWLQNGSYLKVRNISVSYLIPERVAKIGNLKLSLSGQNLFTFTKYKGFDPEVSSTGTSDIDSGLDFGVYPTSKIVTMGISLDF